MEINPRSSSRRWHTTCSHIRVALCVEDSREVLWENKLHVLQGPSKTSNGAVWEPAASLRIITPPFPRETKSPMSLGQGPCPWIQLLPWPTRKPITGHISYSQSSRHFDNPQRKNQNRFFFSKYKYPWWNCGDQGYSGSQCQNAPLDPLLSFSFGFLFLEACSLDCSD